MRALIRLVDRHWTAVAVIVACALSVLLEFKLRAGRVVSRLAYDGTFSGVFATLGGFLITGLTILLALIDHSAMKPVHGTRAFRYIHRSFIMAIWAQVAALVVSIAVKTVDRQMRWLEAVLLTAVLLAVCLFLVAVMFLSIVVNRVVMDRQKR